MVLTLKENNENLEEILSSLINQTFGDNCICINELVDDRMVESDKKA